MTVTPDMPTTTAMSAGFLATGAKAALGVRGGQFVVAPLQRTTGQFDVDDGTRYPLDETGWAQAWFAFGYLDAKAAAEYADAVAGPAPSEHVPHASAAAGLTACPNGHQNREGAAFCSSCGSSIGSQQRCPRGHDLEPNARFCTVCGARSTRPTPTFSAAPYPAEHGSRRPPPSTEVVWGVTLFFGLLGVIPAAIQASAARQDGYPTAPYWRAFWIPAVVVSVIWIAIFASIVNHANSVQDDVDCYSYSEC